MPSTQPLASTTRGWSIACAARISRRDWKNRPPRTRGGASRRIVAAGTRATEVDGRCPYWLSSAASTSTPSTVRIARRTQRPTVMPVGSRSSVAKVSDMGRRLSVPSRAPKSCPRIGSAAAVARRVLIVSWEYPPVVEGGLARHVGKLAEGLAARGDAVDVLTRGRAGEPAREMRAGVRVHRVPAAPTPRDLDPFLRWVDAMNDRMAGAAEAIAATGGVDVVHGHDWLVAPAAARIAERSR